MVEHSHDVGSSYQAAPGRAILGGVVGTVVGLIVCAGGYYAWMSFMIGLEPDFGQTRLWFAVFLVNASLVPLAIACLSGLIGGALGARRNDLGLGVILGLAVTLAGYVAVAGFLLTLKNG